MNQSTQSKSQRDNDTLNVRELLFKYIGKWYLFVISIILCLLLAFVYLKTQSLKYRVQTTILIRDEDPEMGGSQVQMLQSLGLVGGSKRVEDELHIINSPTIMRQAIVDLGVQTSYSYKAGLQLVEEYPTHTVDITYPEGFCDTMRYVTKVDITKRSDDYKIKVAYSKRNKQTFYVKTLNEPVKTQVGILQIKENKPLKKGATVHAETWPLPLLTDVYQKSITASQVKKESNVVQIITVSATPRKAIDILNKVVELYNMDAVADRNMLATATGHFIDERLDLITKELSMAELDVEAYKKANLLTDISSEAKLFLETSSEYQKKLAELETQLNIINYVQTYVQDEKNRYGLIPANIGIQDESLAGLVQEYNAALLERMKLLRTTNVSNPVIVQLEAQLSSVRGNILSSIESQKAGLNIAKNDALSKDRQFMGRISSVPTQERQFLEIKRQQQLKETLYLFLYQKREENALTLASTMQPAKTIDTADYNWMPVAPKFLLVWLCAFILGCCIPVVLILVYDFLNDKIGDLQEYKRLVKAPVIGQICNSNDTNVQVVREGQTTSIAELFRLLRTNLLFMLAGKAHPVVLITSSMTGEGKSFIAVNLASSLSLMKKRVLLVGMDIRSPRLSNYMHLRSTGHLTEYLANTDVEIDDLILPMEATPNLFVVPSGPIPPNPSELLMSSRLDELIAHWREEFDYIIVDTAPIGMVSDTYLLNRLADAVLFVSRAHRTTRSTADFINEQYEHQRLTNMACVLNDVASKTRSGYSYGYGYGDHVHSANSKVKKGWFGLKR